MEKSSQEGKINPAEEKLRLSQVHNQDKRPTRQIPGDAVTVAGMPVPWVSCRC